MNSIALNPSNLSQTQSTSVLVVGSWQRAEFAALRHRLGNSDSWCEVPDIEAASTLLDRNELMPEIVLLAEPLPSTYRHAEIETLRILAPLTLLVVISGTWCEGELRTGKPLQGVLRLYWHELEHWWHARVNETGTWSPCLDGPLTPRGGTAKVLLEMCTAIHAPTLASYEAIAAALGSYGATCWWVRDLPSETANVGIWDGGQLDPKEWERLRHFATRLRENGGKLVVLLDFPRKEHVVRLSKLGCETIIGKPYMVTELVTAIGRLAISQAFRLSS